MPVVGIGIDLIDIRRMKRLRETYGKHALRKVFTDAEIETCLKSHNLRGFGYLSFRSLPVMNSS